MRENADAIIARLRDEPPEPPRQADGVRERRDLAALVLRGEAERVTMITARLAGVAPAPGSISVAEGAIWCAMAPDRVVALCPPSSRALLAGRLGVAVGDGEQAWIADLGDDLVVLELQGPAAAVRLARLGPIDEDAPGSCGTVLWGAVRLIVARVAPDRTLVVVPRGRLDALWPEVSRSAGSA